MISSRKIHWYIILSENFSIKYKAGGKVIQNHLVFHTFQKYLSEPATVFV